MALLLLMTALATAAADGAQPPADGPRVFLDCDVCDLAYVQREIAFVAYVRDRETADIHLLVTRERTASGGQAFTLTFLGRASMAGQDQTLVVTTDPNASEEDTRASIVQTMSLGLLRYLAGTDFGRALEIDIRVPARGPALAPVDRWNHWIFAIRGEAGLEREERTGETEVELSLAADRITADWKLTTGIELAYNWEQFDLGDDDEVESVRREREARALLVRSLGRHWSAGLRARGASSTFENTAAAVQVAPAVEFNVFPYEESTRRELRLLYAVGPRYARYRERTVFDRLSELRPAHEISATLDRVEPWGSTRARIEWSQYLDDLAKNRLEGVFELALRVRRGLAISAQIEGSRLRDQLSLPARGASPEEILLRQRQLASGYEIELAIGITYRFGSIFSPIVNPRFGN
jgi:hypothetical protein